MCAIYWSLVAIAWSLDFITTLESILYPGSDWEFKLHAFKDEQVYKLLQVHGWIHLHCITSGPLQHGTVLIMKIWLNQIILFINKKYFWVLCVLMRIVIKSWTTKDFSSFMSWSEVWEWRSNNRVWLWNRGSPCFVREKQIKRLTERKHEERKAQQ